MASKDLVIERVFDAPRERVFEVFTKPEHVRRWWGPKGHDVPVAEFDARPGGKIFICERDSDEMTLYLAGVVREVEPPSRLVFAIHFANEKGERVPPPPHAGLPAAWDDEIVTTVALSAEGQRTRVSITAHKSGVTSEWLEMAREGWSQTLDKLGDAIAAR